MQHTARARTSDLATFLTIPEAAVRLGVSPDTVRRRIKSGVLTAGVFAGKYRIRVEDVDALVQPEVARA
jgi:excisionase family DNA binding protein